MEVVCIDLPGHGEAHRDTFSTLDDLVEALAQHTQQPALWIGWSLGGLAVIKLALLYPEKVKAVMLVSASPCFVRKENWSCAMDNSVFNGFAEQLESDFTATIRRFLALQVQASASGRKLLKSLREKVLAQPAANITALRAGLKVLKTTDMRDQLKQLTMPVSWVLGGHDSLVRPALANELKLLAPALTTRVYKQAVHAPFLSHLQEFSAQLILFAEHSRASS
jgi:pimeloyl-[acyl-carrier protein] methyl ester esterase